MDDIAVLLLTYASAMRASLEGEADALDLRVGPRMCIEAMTRAAAEITRLRKALAQSPEDAELVELLDLAGDYAVDVFNDFPNKTSPCALRVEANLERFNRARDAIANRLSGVRE